MTEPTEMYVISGSSIQTDVDGRPISIRGTTETSEMITLSMDSLKSNMSNFMQGIQSLMKEVEDKAGQYKVEQIEIAASIGADGKIGFLGSGAGVEATASFTITLTHEEKN